MAPHPILTVEFCKTLERGARDQDAATEPSDGQVAAREKVINKTNRALQKIRGLLPSYE